MTSKSQTPASTSSGTSASDAAGTPGVPANEEEGDLSGEGEDSETVIPVKIKLNLSNEGGNKEIEMEAAKGKPLSLTEEAENAILAVEGYVLDGWYRDAAYTQAWDLETDMIPEEDNFTLYAKWREPNKYTITFDLSGKGENFTKSDVTEGSILSLTETEASPTAEGYAFDGWYKSQEFADTDKWDFEKDRVSGDITLYAKWAALYTVTFDLSGKGTTFTKENLREGSLIPQSDDLQPVSAGFLFDGWYTDPKFAEGTKWDFAQDKVAENTTLYAKWTPVYTVTFDLCGHGDAVKVTDVKEDSLIAPAKVPQPTEEGYHFENWYRDSEYTQLWNFDKDIVTTDITLYAKWVPLEADQFVITFNLSGHGSNFFRYMKAGEKLMESDVTPPEETEYRFLGWYKDAACTDESKWNFDTDTVTGTATLYAKWEEITYTVTFDLSGKGNNVIKSGIKPGALISKTDVPQPVADGFCFENWYKDTAFTQIWNFETETVQNDITLYARWTPLYTVTFKFGEGHGADVIKTVKEGSLIEKTADLQPSADGYHFENWYRECTGTDNKEYKGVWNFETDIVTENITLYAKWTKLEEGQFIVTFNLSGHGADFFQYVKGGDKIAKPKDPADDGYLFLNWYSDSDYESLWDFSKDKVAENMTLYAKWKNTTTLQISSVPSQPYTGKAIKPAISVYEGSAAADDDTADEPVPAVSALKAGKDYTVKYFNNINTNSLLLEEGIRSGICQEDDSIEGGSNSTGEKERGGFNPALPYILIEGKGNYDGRIYMNFVISQISLSDENNQPASGITLNCNDQLPIGKPKKDQQLIASLKYKGALKENQDYTASVTIDGTEIPGSKISKDAAIWTDGGDCTLTITGTGNYSGTIVRSVIVREKNTMLGNATISLGSKCKSKSISSAGEDGVTLIPGWYETTEEEIYDKNGDPVEDSEGNYKTKKVTRYYQYIDGDWTEGEWIYNEKTDEEVLRKADKNNAFTVKMGKEWLKYGDDFEISYTNNTSVGTATMTIIGTGAYTGSKSVNFKITGASGKAFNASTVTFAKDDEGGDGWISKFVYDGTEKTQSVTLETKKRTKIYDCGYENGDEEEYEDQNGNWKTRRHKHNNNCDSHVEVDHIFDPDEYTVTYVNNVNVGTATAVFTADPSSGYSGSFKKTFKITGISMAEFVTFDSEGETLEPVIEETENEVKVGKDEDGEPIYETRYTRKVISTRYLEGTRPYASAGATLNFTLTSEGSDAPLVLNQDYSISYKNHKNVTPWKTRRWREKWQEEDENGKLHWEYGEWEEEEVPNDSKMGALTITGKGNYTGKLTIKYVIMPGELDTEGAVITVARSEYNPKTSVYKPKVTVRTEESGNLSPSEYSVKYNNNTKAAVAAYMEGSGEAPTVTVTFKKSSNYTNLSGEEYDPENPPTLDAPMDFFEKKLTANNLYIIIDNDNPKELVYTGSQVTNISARIYYGDAAAVKAAKKAGETNHRLLTAPTGQSGLYGLTLLTRSTEDNAGNYTVSYGANNAVGKNKGSFTISGIGEYGGSVTQKFTIYRNPVSYTIVAAGDEE